MKAEPWYAPGAKEWLEERIEPGWEAFEWGSGGSTLWLAGLCAKVVSVEHDGEWFQKVSSMVRPADEVLLVVPRDGEACGDVADPACYRSSCLPGDWRLYASEVDLREPDVVLVDGRARASCVAHAVARRPKIIVLDNAERPWYLEKAGKLLDDWKRTDFILGEWITSAWERVE